LLIVANDVGVAVLCPQLEITVIRTEPCVENFRNGDATVCQNQGPRRLLASMSCIALDADLEKLFTHSTRSLIWLRLVGHGARSHRRHLEILPLTSIANAAATRPESCACRPRIEKVVAEAFEDGVLQQRFADHVARGL
jgi:hypothetical protein